MAKQIKINNILGAFKKELGNIYGERLKRVILYGSYARKKANKDSDIDVAVVLRGGIAGREIDRIIDVITEINLKYGVLYLQRERKK